MTTYDMLRAGIFDAEPRARAKRAGIEYAELSHKYGRPYMHISAWYFYRARLRTPILRERDRIITTAGLT